MTYVEYKELRAQGRVRAGIDSSVAMRLIDSLSTSQRAALTFWNVTSVLSAAGSIAVAIFFKWWVGLLLLVFVPATIWSANKKSAAGFVLQHAEDSEEFFNMLVEKDLLALQVDEE